MYIKNNNVWLANPDGSGQYQVTLDGTSQPGEYHSRSQADDGTIVALDGLSVVRVLQNGQELTSPSSGRLAAVLGISENL